MKTVLCPYDLPNNISFHIKRKYLQENGYEIEKLSEAIKNNFRDCKLVNLNFYESVYTKSPIKGFVTFIIKCIVLDWMKFRNVKIIYTMHNKIGHDSQFDSLELFLMKKLFLTSDTIVILCDESKDIIKNIIGEKYETKIANKIEKIPLVSYEGFYPIRGVDIRSKYGIAEDVMIYAFIGGIRKYKNIDLIIDCARQMSDKKCVFIIAGAGDNSYIAELKEDAKKFHNVIIVDHYIPNEEMADFANGVDVFVFPYDKKSSLNSGSCLYAFSHKRNVICPKIGTIKELANDVTYSYCYETAEQHAKELKNQCLRAYKEWAYDRELFRSKQISLYKESCTVNSYNRIAKLYSSLYKKLIGES